MWDLIEKGLEHNGLVTAFAFVGVIAVGRWCCQTPDSGAFTARRLPSSSAWSWPGSAAP